ncbi:MAG: hypothetical protein JW937_08180 [Candidatus Omnitrophica bacterium]|nr:hypothetical protein [Candidatus Omnitrophota bacterium]
MSQLRRLTALFVAQVFLLSNMGLGMAAPTTPAPESVPYQPKSQSLKSINDLVIPSTVGRITQLIEGTGDKTIIHVQDLHTHAEAQLNESAIIKYLVEEYGVDLVCSEGADGFVHPGILAAFPPEQADRERIARAFVDSGELTGEEYLSMTSHPEVLIWGVEDAQLYSQQFNTYREMLGPEYEQAKGSIAKLISALSDLKPGIYGSMMSELDSRAAQFQAGRLSMVDFARHMLDVAGSNSVLTLGERNLEALVKANDMEAELDFGAAEANVREWVAYLSGQYSAAGDNEAAAGLLAKGAALREGTLQAYDYYSYLVDEAAGYATEEAPATEPLSQLIAYLDLSSRIDPAQLFPELRSLRDKLVSNLATSEEAGLHKLIQNAATIQNFFNVRTNNRDLEAYNADRAAYRSSAFRSFLVNHGQVVGVDELLAWDKHMMDLEKFYQTAHDRDDAFLRNALDIMDRTQKKTAILVTGGFHTQGMVEDLKAQGINVAVIAPNITKPHDHERYQAMIKGERVPLEQIAAQIEAGRDEGMRLGLAFGQALRTANLNDPRNIIGTAIQFYIDEQGGSVAELEDTLLPALLDATEVTIDGQTVQAPGYILNLLTQQNLSGTVADQVVQFLQNPDEQQEILNFARTLGTSDDDIDTAGYVFRNDPRLWTGYPTDRLAEFTQQFKTDIWDAGLAEGLVRLFSELNSLNLEGITVELVNSIPYDGNQNIQRVAKTVSTPSGTVIQFNAQAVLVTSPDGPRVMNWQEFTQMQPRALVAAVDELMHGLDVVSRAVERDAENVNATDRDVYSEAKAIWLQSNALAEGETTQLARITDLQNPLVVDGVTPFLNPGNWTLSEALEVNAVLDRNLQAPAVLEEFLVSDEMVNARNFEEAYPYILTFMANENSPYPNLRDRAATMLAELGGADAAQALARTAVDGVINNFRIAWNRQEIPVDVVDAILGRPLNNPSQALATYTNVLASNISITQVGVSSNDYVEAVAVAEGITGTIDQKRRQVAGLIASRFLQDHQSGQGFPALQEPLILASMVHTARQAGSDNVSMPDANQVANWLWGLVTGPVRADAAQTRLAQKQVVDTMVGENQQRLGDLIWEILSRSNTSDLVDFIQQQQDAMDFAQQPDKVDAKAVERLQRGLDSVSEISQRAEVVLDWIVNNLKAFPWVSVPAAQLQQKQIEGYLESLRTGALRQEQIDPMLTYRSLAFNLAYVTGLANLQPAASTTARRADVKVARDTERVLSKLQNVGFGLWGGNLYAYNVNVQDEPGAELDVKMGEGWGSIATLNQGTLTLSSKAVEAEYGELLAAAVASAVSLNTPVDPNFQSFGGTEFQAMDSAAITVSYAIPNVDLELAEALACKVREILWLVNALSTGVLDATLFREQLYTWHGIPTEDSAAEVYENNPVVNYCAMLQRIGEMETPGNRAAAARSYLAAELSLARAEIREVAQQAVLTEVAIEEQSRQKQQERDGQGGGVYQLVGLGQPRPSLGSQQEIGLALTQRSMANMDLAIGIPADGATRSIVHFGVDHIGPVLEQIAEENQLTRAQVMSSVRDALEGKTAEQAVAALLEQDLGPLARMVEDLATFSAQSPLNANRTFVLDLVAHDSVQQDALDFLKELAAAVGVDTQVPIDLQGYSHIHFYGNEALNDNFWLAEQLQGNEGLVLGIPDVSSEGMNAQTAYAFGLGEAIELARNLAGTGAQTVGDLLGNDAARSLLEQWGVDVNQFPDASTPLAQVILYLAIPQIDFEISMESVAQEVHAAAIIARQV